jgi:thiamine pyrophosphate-dependent acetolactate synthase large subunit-like protein
MTCRHRAIPMSALGIRVGKPSEIGPAIAWGPQANRPVIIDVVAAIDAIAPMAVT